MYGKDLNCLCFIKDLPVVIMAAHESFMQVQLRHVKPS